MRKLAPQRDQIVVELEARDLVERRERLVHQQHARRGDQRARDRHPHPHAAGQFARIGLGEIGKADARQRLHDARRGRGPVDAGELQRQEDVAEHRRPRHQRRLLEHEADAAARVARRSRQVTVPRVGSLRPAMMRSAVDLPQPDGPSSDRNSPSRTSRSSPSSASVPVPNSLADAAQRNDRRGRGSRHRGYFRRPISVRNATQRLTSAAWWAVNSFDALPGHRLEADGAELLLDVRLLDHLDDRRAELLADVLRHFRRAVDAEPAGQHDAGHAGLLEGRHVRHRRQALGAAHREALDRARADLLAHHRRHLDDELDLARRSDRSTPAARLDRARAPC